MGVAIISPVAIKEDRENKEVGALEKFLEKYELHRASYDFTDRIIIIVIGALGLIAALAWDDALKGIFETFFGEQHTLGEKIFYAFLITAVAAGISVTLRRFLLRKNRKALPKK